VIVIVCRFGVVVEVYDVCLVFVDEVCLMGVMFV